MIPQAMRQERLSLAYIRAVAASAGFSFSEPEEDYGIDAEISVTQEVEGRYVSSGEGLSLQVKSTITADFTETEVVYPLKVSNYNMLVSPNFARPRILVLFCLPREENLWLEIEEDASRIRSCAYWISLQGRPISLNEKTVTIRIPRTNLFDQYTLRCVIEGHYAEPIV